MELVNVCLYAEGCYGGVIYEDDIWIKKSSYEKLRDDFPTEISCGELDGWEYSEVMGDVEIQDDWETDEEYAEAGLLASDCDGGYLEYELKELYEENGIDWNLEQKEIKEYFKNLDVWKKVTVCIPSSKMSELMKFVETLK